jgi:Protein of unknown function (DUF2441)
MLQWKKICTSFFCWLSTALCAKENNLSVANPEQDYFHINRVVEWSPHEKLSAGDKFDVGGESNPYFRFFEKFHKTVPVTNTNDGKIMDVPGVKFVGEVANGKINSPDVAKIAHGILKHFVAYIRELIWEDVRKKEFPHLPSRQRCYWLIPNIEGVKYWCGRLALEKTEFQVIRVRVQGRLHKASEKYLLGDSEPLEVSIQKARQYWLGVVEESSSEEIIFEGQVTVQEVIDPAVYA